MSTEKTLNDFLNNSDGRIVTAQFNGRTVNYLFLKTSYLGKLRIDRKEYIEHSEQFAGPCVEEDDSENFILYFNKREKLPSQIFSNNGSLLYSKK